MIIRLVIATSLALFVGFSLADTLETPERVAVSGAPAKVVVAPLSVAFTSPMIVAADGQLVALEVAVQEETVVQEVAEAIATTPQFPVKYVTATRVNYRSGPGQDNPVLGQVDFADAVSVVAILDNGWAEILVEGDGGAGFVAARFLADNPPG